MPSVMKWFPKPKVMKLRWGRGHKKVMVAGTYKRGKKISHHIPRLDAKRHATKEWNSKQHHAHEHFTDTPKSFI
jgi:hypothetical protein